MVCALSTPATVRAVGEEITEQPEAKIVISELSPESKQSASQEHLVLYNAGTEAVDVSGWQLQYRSASHMAGDEKGWGVKAIIGCAEILGATCRGEQGSVEIAPGGTLRLSTNKDPVGSDLPFISGMATSGGQVRLLGAGPSDASAQQKIYDFVGYGTARAFEGAGPATAPKAGRSIVRMEAAGRPQDTDYNAADFVLQPDPDEVLPGRGGVDGEDVRYLAPIITEVLPDPASPQTDSDHEFIELYNPFDVAIDLDGYTLVTGANWTRSYRIEDTTLDPREYVSLMAATTNISLSNTGTGVRLLDPAGDLLFEMPSYGKAIAGSSWAQDGEGRWGWTAQPTPGAANVIVEPITKAAAVAAGSAKAVKTSTSKAKASTTSKSSPKKAAQTAAKTTAKTPGEGAAASTQSNQVNYLILAVAAAIAGGYILFEYRRDIALFARTTWQRIKGISGK